MCVGMSSGRIAWIVRQTCIPPHQGCTCPPPLLCLHTRISCVILFPSYSALLLALSCFSGPRSHGPGPFERTDIGTVCTAEVCCFAGSFLSLLNGPSKPQIPCLRVVWGLP